MSSIKKYIALIVVLFLVQITTSFEAKAQAPFTIKEFSEDSVKFFEEMSNFLMSAKKKEGKQFMEEFELVWYGGKFSENQRKTIYRTCNFMLEKKLHPYPEFESYLFSLMSFIESGQTNESFNAWTRSLNLLMEGKNKRKFAEYLDFSSKLFEENDIYHSASTVWQSSNSNYIFEMEGDVPKIIFPSLDLKCLAKGDSAIIYNTKGYYYPTLKEWYGDKGLVDWQRAGFSRDTVYAEIPHKYKISVHSASFEMDSVIFYNYRYFDKPLWGRLEEKVLANVTEEKASYPRFESYSARLRIKNIAPNVDYEGGFSQHGAKFKGSGNEGEDATMIYYWEDEPILKVSSRNFAIRPTRFSAAKAACTFYLKEDSISHPGLKYSYHVDTKQLTLVRSEEGLANSPYFNSYHDIDMYFEALYWTVDNPLIEMKSLEGSSDKRASFESAQYFRESLFDRLQGIDEVHPLTALRMCSRKEDSRELWLSQIVEFMHLPPNQVKMMLFEFAVKGFLFFDAETEKVILKDKLFHFVDAKAKKVDYDVIKLSSDVDDNSNATLNLLNYDLTIRGVKNVILSDSQKVYFYPVDRTLILKKDLDMDFSGVLNAGHFEFFGKDYKFHYNDFNIKMPLVDSLRIWAISKKTDDYGNTFERRVISVIEGLKGELAIDLPNNKAGIEPADEYPVFDSQKDSYVFYQKGSIQKGVYDKKRFFFHLDPFVFDSLNMFYNDMIHFDGEFQSAGIFPTFREKLVLMPDYSLGFDRKTPDNGYDMYGNKGKFTANIKLSHKGLRGDGRLDYLVSTAKSDDFIFYPDSVRGIAQSYVIEEVKVGAKVEYPKVTGSNVDISWKPYRDFMDVHTIKEPILMYDETKLTGKLTLRPTGLEGAGLLEFDGAELESNLYKFKNMVFDADTSDFRLKSLEESSALSFSTTNVKAHVDFNQRKADFLSNGGGSLIDFPVNQYVCYMDKFTWYMDDESIELGASEAKGDQGASDVKLEGSKFISVHPDQDSLMFYSPKAKYDLRKNIINAEEVKFINVADAMITPHEGKVVIEKKARMLPLEQAEITANSVTRYHKIYDAKVKIHSRKNYNASGKYDYKDELKQVKTILFEDIKVDTTFQTYADGVITKEEEFTLSPSFEYYGKVTLKAAQRFLIFTGTSTILHNCELIPRHSFQFTAEINPNDIYIPIDTTILAENNDKLYAGIMMDGDSSSIYSTFISPVRSAEKDNYIASATGFLYFNKPTGEYKISSMDKLKSNNLPGNYISLDTRNCKIYSEGALNFSADLGQVKVSPYGQATHEFNKDSLYMDLLMVVDFFFLENELEDLGKKINEVEGIEMVNVDRKIYEKGLQEIVGKEAADKLISQMSLSGEFKRVPDELNKSFFINDVKMRWNSETGSYMSVGDKLGMGNIYKRQINKYVKGYVEIAKSRSGDEFSLYFETMEGNWYFFRYKKFVMQAISSDDSFNAAVKDAKTEKRKMKVGKGEAPYQFMLGTARKKSEFVRQFEGGEE